MRLFENLLLSELFALVLVFARMGSALMVLPLFGEQSIPTRARLLFAVAVTMTITPFLTPSLPTLPPTVSGLAILLIGEILIGILLALLVRILFTALEVAGSAIVFQMGLSSATIFNPMISEQTSAIASLLGLIALVIMMQTDMHHVLLRGIVDSYGLFLPGQGIVMGDASESIVRAVSQAFRVGIQMTGPFFVVMMMINVALGLLARLMPQLQVFFLAQPVQIIVGFILLLATLTSIMYLFVDTIGGAIQGLLTPGVP
ncbi:hypothetical protein VZ95_20445 [Elstera litoralis]|uniref:Flagellar biosynthetic protein FliR n=1 Tax=Elstera litoralis TaxID=552518 RepID=A0A0F3IJH2_9PROT|nr:flagellar biosynthetic protein FliR [Elstera litoralis]KJV06920.1 hypothetical protein VZ95_20445 [Elstera litoralis]